MDLLNTCIWVVITMAEDVFFPSSSPIQPMKMAGAKPLASTPDINSLEQSIILNAGAVTRPQQLRSTLRVVSRNAGSAALVMPHKLAVVMELMCLFSMTVRNMFPALTPYPD
jgi:hypothetical protein